MRDIMGVNAPMSTPSTLKEYQRLEELFLSHCRESGRTPASIDLEIWVNGSGRRAVAL